jgi:hypothetical protein
MARAESGRRAIGVERDKESATRSVTLDVPMLTGSKVDAVVSPAGSLTKQVVDWR